MQKGTWAQKGSTKMADLQYIHLHHLRFWAFHGVYAEETVLGNEFEVNVDVAFTPAPAITLADTINYVAVYDLVKQQMAQTSGLLETVAQQTCRAIKALDGRIQQVTVHIMKLHVPIPQFVGRVGVTCSL
jgi:7,8-dihydroneopterin aldolase/epimerase/oxygenase